MNACEFGLQTDLNLHSIPTSAVYGTTSLYHQLCNAGGLVGLQVYTNWVNRYLSKAPKFKPIVDISTELRDYRLVAKLIRIVVFSKFRQEFVRLNNFNINGKLFMQ
ncbi:hypothetical protein DICVIV_01894 [Dictyocaulus viviparus]|uniref:Uncharacterized protein n=1 Tax=Dictyocaulus viviparus TaxID=29172 RepID=A0A0D8Y4X4_DICVI|nr:hypothetical protein DICVIV_01894 [Dictyocaulus viviparus]